MPSQSAYQFWNNPAKKIAEHGGLMPAGLLAKPPLKAIWCSYLVTLGCVRILYWVNSKKKAGFEVARVATVIAHVAEAAIWWACALSGKYAPGLTPVQILTELMTGKREGGIAHVLLIGVPVLTAAIALAPAPVEDESKEKKND